MAIDLGEIEKELEEEIRELELEKAGYEARLDEKRRLLSRLRHGAAEQPSAPAPEDPVQSSAIVNSGRVSITDLGKHHYETAGHRFKNAGQLLDHFDVPPLLLSQTPKEGGRGGAGDPSVDEAQSESGRYSRRGALRRLTDGSGHSRKPHLARRLGPQRWTEASQATRRPWQIPPPGIHPPSSRLCGQS